MQDFRFKVAKTSDFSEKLLSCIVYTCYTKKNTYRANIGANAWKQWISSPIENYSFFL
jgi:hypothetical protein